MMRPSGIVIGASLRCSGCGAIELKGVPVRYDPPSGEYVWPSTMDLPDGWAQHDFGLLCRECNSDTGKSHGVGLLYDEREKR